MRIVLVLFISNILIACNCQNEGILTGADQIETILNKIEGKNVALVTNHTSRIRSAHIVDTLLSYSNRELKIAKVFAPEHGFRGKADAGATVENQVDVKTGLPIISLYGKNRKPSKEQLEGIDIVIFDIQDIGIRFYTYISTMHNVMEACAENQIQFLVLDRPNPNGNYVDGPVMEDEYKSFVGMHSIPIVHGLTVAELALMINGEGWLENGVKCDLSYIPCLNYDHKINYSLPVMPSPNLPNNHSIRLYPSTCFFEGTVISEGRGTLNPFEVFGHPDLPGDYSFIPRSIEGMSMQPKLKNIECRGTDLRNYIPAKGWNKIELTWLISTYNEFPDKDSFFIPYFENLAGTASLREQIESGWSEEEIRKSWQPGLEEYLKMREKYLIYP